MESATAPATGPAVDDLRRLVRPREGRMVGGVCAGLGRYFGIDPRIYRLAIAALAVLGGSGLVLYAIAWLVMPDEDADGSVVERFIRDHRDRPLLLGIAAVLAVVALLGAFGASSPHLGGIPWAALVVVIVGWLWLRRASLPLVERRRRGRQIFRGGALGIAAAGSGLALVDAAGWMTVDWGFVAGMGAVYIAMLSVISAVFSHTWLLSTLGVVVALGLGAISVSDVSLRGPVGDRLVAPATAGELAPRYEQSVGRLHLDLASLALPVGTTTRVAATVGVGSLEIDVPRDARVIVRERVRIGGAEAFGVRDDGFRLDETRSAPGASEAPTIVIDAQVRVGDIRVERG